MCGGGYCGMYSSAFLSLQHSCIVSLGKGNSDVPSCPMTSRLLYSLICRWMILGLLCSVITSPTAGAAEQLSESAEKFAQRFYTTLLKVKPLGLPSDAQWKKLAPFFNGQIRAAVAKSRRQEAAFVKQHPGEVPPFSDGDLFSSLFEGPTSFAVGSVKQKGDAFLVPIALTYRQGKEHTEWTDQLVLTQEPPQGWQVNDIRFGGKWAFKSSGSLRRTLGLAK